MDLRLRKHKNIHEIPYFIEENNKLKSSTTLPAGTRIYAIVTDRAYPDNYQAMLDENIIYPCMLIESRFPVMYQHQNMILTDTNQTPKYCVPIKKQAWHKDPQDITPDDLVWSKTVNTQIRKYANSLKAAQMVADLFENQKIIMFLNTIAPTVKNLRTRVKSNENLDIISRRAMRQLLDTVITFDVLESNIFPDNMEPVSEEIFEKKGM